jgi:hypothetical protein
MDNGYNPKVAVVGSTVVEVHNGGNSFGPMWYHVGHINADDTITWTPTYYPYENGYNPSVAAYGSTVVEVHNGGNSFGPMWYKLGQINANNTITWGPGYPYENGFNPSVAVSGSVQLVVVEVHNGQASEGPTWYKVGYVEPNNTIYWGPGYQYDYGWNPSVTHAYNNCGFQSMEVHNAGTSFGPMWYHPPSNGGHTLYNILWLPSQFFDNGFNPSVATSTYGVVQVHNGGTFEGPMWYSFTPSNCG